MSYYSEKLRKKFPNLKDGDWELYHNGIDGTKLKWNRPEPPPSIDEIDAFYSDKIIEQDNPSPEAAITNNPINNALLKVIAEVTNTPYEQIVSKLKTYVTKSR